MNPITFDDWNSAQTALLWATENGGNASQVIQYLEQNQINYSSCKGADSDRWIFTIYTTNQKAPEIIQRMKQF
nr:MAG TPA: hypothetical protein [Caudoviricetes sp.]